MTQDERWMVKYIEVVTFIETNKRNPSRHRIEEHDYLNWLKANRKALNAGKMKPERVEKFRKLLEMTEQYRRKNQWEWWLRYNRGIRDGRYVKARNEKKTCRKPQGTVAEDIREWENSVHLQFLPRTKGFITLCFSIWYVSLPQKTTYYMGPTKRRDRDSNPGYPLGVYTLSRRASSATRASLLIKRQNDVASFFGLQI